MTVMEEVSRLTDPLEQEAWHAMQGHGVNWRRGSEGENVGEFFCGFHGKGEAREGKQTG